MSGLPALVPAKITFDVEQKHIDRAYAAKLGGDGYVFRDNYGDTYSFLPSSCCCPNVMALHDKFTEVFGDKFNGVEVFSGLVNVFLSDGTRIRYTVCNDKVRIVIADFDYDGRKSRPISGCKIARSLTNV